LSSLCFSSPSLFLPIQSCQFPVYLSSQYVMSVSPSVLPISSFHLPFLSNFLSSCHPDLSLSCPVSCPQPVTQFVCAPPTYLSCTIGCNFSHQL
jgi:hypothetical protein